MHKTFILLHLFFLHACLEERKKRCRSPPTTVVLRGRWVKGSSKLCIYSATTPIKRKRHKLVLNFRFALKKKELDYLLAIINLLYGMNCEFTYLSPDIFISFLNILFLFCPTPQPYCQPIVFDWKR